MGSFFFLNPLDTLQVALLPPRRTVWVRLRRGGSQSHSPLFCWRSRRHKWNFTLVSPSHSRPLSATHLVIWPETNTCTVCTPPPWNECKDELMPCSVPWNEWAGVDAGSSGLEGAGKNKTSTGRSCCARTPSTLSVSCRCGAYPFASLQLLSHYPAATKQIIYLLYILMATPPTFYQPDAADAASEGLNESNPVQISVFHLDHTAPFPFISCQTP